MTSHDDCAAIYALRREVFVDELHMPEHAARDEADAMAYYALVFDEQGIPSATGRLTLDNDRFLIGRVCVRKAARGQGLGDLVMRMLLVRAQELNAHSVWVLSRQDAAPFYARYGLKPAGDPVFDEGETKRWMHATADEIDVEGACQKQGAASGCESGCADCHGCK